MLFSRASEYALQACLFLAKTDASSYIRVREIAEKIRLSHFFLGKVMQKLTQTGLVESYKGPNGGVRLARPASSITLFQVVDAVERFDCDNTCLLGNPRCNEENPCVLHSEWNAVRNQIRKLLQSNTLGDF